MKYAMESIEFSRFISFSTRTNSVLIILILETRQIFRSNFWGTDNIVPLEDSVVSALKKTRVPLYKKRARNDTAVEWK